MHPDLPLVAMLSILGTLAIGAMSPGPSFVVVVRASAGLSRRDGLASALGTVLILLTFLPLVVLFTFLGKREEALV